jgi:phage terminase large subunit
MVKLNRKKIRCVIASVDWGFTNPGVILVWAIDNDGRMYMIYEIYRTRQLIEWWVKEACRLKGIFNIEVFVCDPSEPAYIEQFRQAGLQAVRAKNDVAPGVQAVQQRLRVAGDGLPRIFFYLDANESLDAALSGEFKPSGVIQEFPEYVWSTADGGKTIKEEPVKADDHGMDCIRYAVAYVDGGVTTQGVTFGSITKVSRW